MDRPAFEAKKITALAGIDLDLGQELPPSPTPDEVAEARSYLRHVIARSETPLAE